MEAARRAAGYERPGNRTSHQQILYHPGHHSVHADDSRTNDSAVRLWCTPVSGTSVVILVAMSRIQYALSQDD